MLVEPCELEEQTIEVFLDEIFTPHSSCTRGSIALEKCFWFHFSYTHSSPGEQIAVFCCRLLQALQTPSQLCLQGHHIGGLKSALVGGFNSMETSRLHKIQAFELVYQGLLSSTLERKTSY